MICIANLIDHLHLVCKWCSNSNKKIKLSSDASSLLETSLGVGGTSYLGNTVYMTACAITKTKKFAADTLLVNAYSQVDQDVMGYDPDKFPSP